MTRRLIISLLLMTPLMAACGTSSTDNSTEGNTQRISVAVALYPIAEIVQRVGGDSVSVLNLTPPGTDAHDVELTAKQVQQLEESDVVFYFGDDFQPSVEKAVSALTTSTTVNLLDSVELLSAAIEEEHAEDEHAHEEHAHGEHDPHVWLDPANMIAMTKKVSETLSAARPKSTATFSANSAAYIDELSTLGTLIDSSIGIADGQKVSRCAEKNLYTAHQGFAYLAHRAGLTLVPITGINPDQQVSAKYLESLSSTLKGKETTIFFESLISSSAAEALAKSAGVATDVLNPVEGLSQQDIDNGTTYISAQQDNVARIAKGLRCS